MNHRNSRKIFLCFWILHFWKRLLNIFCNFCALKSFHCLGVDVFWLDWKKIWFSFLFICEIWLDTIRTCNYSHSNLNWLTGMQAVNLKIAMMSVLALSFYGIHSRKAKPKCAKASPYTHIWIYGGKVAKTHPQYQALLKVNGDGEGFNNCIVIVRLKIKGVVGRFFQRGLKRRQNKKTCKAFRRYISRVYFTKIHFAKK